MKDFAPNIDKWVNLLQNLNVPADRIQKIAKYAIHDSILQHKNNITHSNINTTALAIEFLSKMNNFDKIIFMDQPVIADKPDGVISNVTRLKYSDYDEKRISKLVVDKLLEEVSGDDISVIYIYHLFAHYEIANDILSSGAISSYTDMKHIQFVSRYEIIKINDNDLKLLIDQGL